MNLNLPIDVIPGTNPPRFKWRQVISTPVSYEPRTIQHDGLLPPTVEQALVALIDMVKQLAEDNERLRRNAAAQHRPRIVTKE